MIINTPTWPVVIKYTGEDELFFIKSDQQWTKDADLNCDAYITDDELIDSEGIIYSLSYNSKNKHIEICKTTKIKSIFQFEILIKNHMVILNQCCSTKITLRSIADGMLLLDKMNE